MASTSRPGTSEPPRRSSRLAGEQLHGTIKPSVRRTKEQAQIDKKTTVLKAAEAEARVGSQEAQHKVEDLQAQMDESYIQMNDLEDEASKLKVKLGKATGKTYRDLTSKALANHKIKYISDMLSDCMIQLKTAAGIHAELQSDFDAAAVCSAQRIAVLTHSIANLEDHNASLQERLQESQALLDSHLQPFISIFDEPSFEELEEQEDKQMAEYLRIVTSGNNEGLDALLASMLIS